MSFTQPFLTRLSGFPAIRLPARDCRILQLLLCFASLNFSQGLYSYRASPDLPVNRVWPLGSFFFSRSPLTAASKNNLPRKFRGKCVFVVFQTCCMRVSTGKICCTEKQDTYNNNDNDSTDRMAQTGMEFLWIVEVLRTVQETLRGKPIN